MSVVIYVFVNIVPVKHVEGLSVIERCINEGMLEYCKQMGPLNDGIEMNNHRIMIAIFNTIWRHYPHACVGIRPLSKGGEPMNQRAWMCDSFVLK